MALSNKQKAGGVAAACAAAALACLPLTKSSEGERLKPYRDPANIVTWCYGETHGLRKTVYTDAECSQLLQTRLAKQYAPGIARCLPEVTGKDRIKVFAALLDASYNAGMGGVCGSPMARYIHQGHWVSACNAFSDPYRVDGMLIHGWFASATYRGKPHSIEAMSRAGWTYTIHGWRKELPGLVKRRIREHDLCLATA